MLDIYIYIAAYIKRNLCNDNSNCLYCVEINHSANQRDVRGYRKSRRLTWAESGGSPQRDRLVPTASPNVLFLPLLMNPEEEKNEWT